MKIKFLVFLIVCAVIFKSTSVIALDTFIVDRALSDTDNRNEYSDQLLEKVLKRTEKKFGPYKLEKAKLYMERQRLLIEMQKGDSVNITAKPTRPEWENRLTPIFIPVDMGLQSWRIGLIHSKNRAKMQKIKLANQLKNLQLGGGSGWTTEVIFRDAGFKLQPGVNYDGLFGMLMQGHSDYLLQGVNEIFVALDDHKKQYPELSIEDNFLVHVKLPLLFFVSPKNPRLAERILFGLELMLNDGTLKKYMLSYHKNMLKKAKLCNRQIFEVKNKINIKLEERNSLWFDPFDPANGICKKRS